MNSSFIYRGREVEVVTKIIATGYGFDIFIGRQYLNTDTYEGASTEQEAFDDGLLFARNHVDDISPEGSA